MSYIDDEGRVTVEIAGQWTHEDQEQIAHALDLPLERVRVIYPADRRRVRRPRGHVVADRHGARRDAAGRAGRAPPDRRRCGRGRSPSSGTTSGTVAASTPASAPTRDGTDHRRRGDDPPRRRGVQLHDEQGARELPICRSSVRTRSQRADRQPRRVHQRRARRGVPRVRRPAGHLRRRDPAEQARRRLGLDPVDVRRRNLIHDGSIGITQTPFPAGVTMPEVARQLRGRRRTGTSRIAGRWRAAGSARSPPLPPHAPAVRQGRGIACALKNVGFSFGFPERCEADDRAARRRRRPERVDLFHGGADVGQGAHTAFVQMAAEATGSAGRRSSAARSPTPPPPATRGRRRRRG